MKQKQTDRINSDAVQAANDYYAALAALALPRSATPLEVNARIEKLKSDMLALACLYDEILGDDRITCDNDTDFRVAISAVRSLRDDQNGRTITYHPNDGGGICHYHSGCKDCLENLEAEGAK